METEVAQFLLLCFLEKHRLGKSSLSHLAGLMAVEQAYGFFTNPITVFDVGEWLNYGATLLLECDKIARKLGKPWSKVVACLQKHATEQDLAWLTPWSREKPVSYRAAFNMHKTSDRPVAQPGKPPPAREGGENSRSPSLPAQAGGGCSAPPGAENTKLPDWMEKLFLSQCIIELSNFTTKNILAALFERATVAFLPEQLNTMLKKAQISRVKRQSSQKSSRCYRCGSEKHIRKNCNEKVWCSRCNRDSHSTEACRNKKDKQKMTGGCAAAAAPTLHRTPPECHKERPVAEVAPTVVSGQMTTRAEVPEGAPVGGAASHPRLLHCPNCDVYGETLNSISPQG